MGLDVALALDEEQRHESQFQGRPRPTGVGIRVVFQTLTAAHHRHVAWWRFKMPDVTLRLAVNGRVPNKPYQGPAAVPWQAFFCRGRCPSLPAPNPPPAV